MQSRNNRSPWPVAGGPPDAYIQPRADFIQVYTGHRLSLFVEPVVKRWLHMLEAHHLETSEHCQRVARLTLRLARKIGLESVELAHLYMGALLHDIGKIHIPRAILNKKGSLTEAEWRIMRLHPLYAYEILHQTPYLRAALDIPFFHHERWDGSGYPFGLQGEQIPLAARLFAVVDVWDALRSHRPYRPAWPVERVCGYLLSAAGTLFDAQVVDVFLSLPDLH